MAFKTSGSMAAGFAFSSAGLIALPSSFEFFGFGFSKDKGDDKSNDDKDSKSTGPEKKAPSTPEPAAPAVKRLRFVGGIANIPHDDKVDKGGEDAWTASQTLIAVADGVGGWANKGVDSGLFSKQLTKDI